MSRTTLNNSHQVAVNRGVVASPYRTLFQRLNRVEVETQPSWVTVSVPKDDDYIVLTPGDLAGANLAILNLLAANDEAPTQANNGYVVAVLPGGIPLGSNQSLMVQDSYGNILNYVSVRQQDGNNRLQIDGFDVFGLLQVPDGFEDDDAPGGSQISFFTLDENDAMQPVVLSTEAALSVEVAFSRAHVDILTPRVVRRGGLQGEDVISAGVSKTINETIYTVTETFQADEVIKLATGLGDTDGGEATKPTTGHGSAVISATNSIGASATVFNENNELEILVNGLPQTRGTEVIWDSNITMHFTYVLHVGDEITIRTQTK